MKYSDIRFSRVYLMFGSFFKVYYELTQILTEQKKSCLKEHHYSLESLSIYLKRFLRCSHKIKL